MDRVAAQGGNGSGGGRTGFVSDKQRGLFERLLKESGFNDAGVAEVCDWARSTMSGGRGQGISKAIDGLMDKSTRTEIADRLGKAAKDFTGQVAEEVTNGPAEDIPVETTEADEAVPF
jgi:hypothetical protein